MSRKQNSYNRRYSSQLIHTDDSLYTEIIRLPNQPTKSFSTNLRHSLRYILSNFVGALNPKYIIFQTLVRIPSMNNLLLYRAYLRFYHEDDILEGKNGNAKPFLQYLLFLVERILSNNTFTNVQNEAMYYLLFEDSRLPSSVLEKIKMIIKKKNPIMYGLFFHPKRPYFKTMEMIDDQLIRSTSTSSTPRTPLTLKTLEDILRAKRLWN